MAIIIKTKNADAILKVIRDGIKSKNIETWEEDPKDYFTHTTKDKQWYKKAWFRAVKDEKTEELRFAIYEPDGKGISRGVYAVYHGRFMEMLIAHCHKLFDFVSASSQKEKGDNFKWQEE